MQLPSMKINRKMNSVLFFLGTAIRSMALKPKIFVLFHGYISFIYILNFKTQAASVEGYGLLFTLLVLLPLLLAIYKGLPVDCLNYEVAIRKEIESLRVYNT